ncbi:hypothetical protein AiwAL_05420 [Acidiphilium sp. AL]|uniref:Uncharacterized protein n=1 Tax=Acidiphilium iwatense TaxID=768198 RepID=A0ABS9DSJ5_9PROT|nr:MULTISPECIES: hypothetical protein [Acidiphilium]MCF3945652.1 hypothetical protein [Acidiphilium iwatense]MCU4159541.1 hypothetical protein [Acidiphilium sp. AL]
MIIPTQGAGAQPIAYGGGMKPASQPGFGAALTAMLAQMQATAPAPGLAVHQAHKHGHGAAIDHAGGSIAPPKLG